MNLIRKTLLVGKEKYIYTGRVFYLETSKYLKKYTHRTKKEVRNKKLLFSKRKCDSKKIYPTTLGQKGGINLKFQMRTSFFYCKFGLSIKKDEYFVCLYRFVFYFITIRIFFQGFSESCVITRDLLNSRAFESSA